MLSAALADAHSRELLDASLTAYPARARRRRAARQRARALAARLRSH